MGCCWTSLNKNVREAWFLREVGKRDNWPLHNLMSEEEHMCYVTDVYDGDTITAIIQRNTGLEKHVIRLFGVDTPELRPPHKKFRCSSDREVHIQKAIEAREFVKGQVLNKLCYIQFQRKPDKYGRLLGTIHHNGRCINEALLEQKLAVPYNGGKKTL